ncbi:hypothetical protein N658DRAFT_519333 [Parathielavia hyrcaniae]|uniref:Uncharacterized protein n=1 Tax=Parathielavia hyrcaniae TaxID=113614 RepID=A0AAN6PVN8_9PEZI|nr:hypothetical protein N658DRAFT_519333 [Parathielavia hyrcaniae]
MIIFSPNCTLPGHDRGLVASPSVRSTADIVWSCVATLLLCCWSILHLKVPPQFQPTNRSQRNFRAAWLVWRKVKWMCVSILAPEAVLAKAVTDFLAARANTKLIGAFAEEDKVQWTESHSFLADMGGFTIRFSELICELPNVTKDDILDRSKGDWLVKVLASLQIAWLGLQVVWRWYLDIATTPLEVMTFAFAATAVITYLFLMRHPKDVMTTIYLRATKAASPEDVRAIYASGPRHFGMMKGIDEHAVPNNAINTAACEWFDHEGAETAYIACLYIGSAIFCGLHLLAWNFPFPTAVDQVIWRVATLVSIMAPVGIPFLVCIPYRAGWSCCRKTGDEGAQKRVEGLLVSSATFGVLVVARLLLIVEVFRTLYFLPQDAYLSTWTSNMPHMG